jgi:phycobilisome core-membrane linker protein
LGRAPLNQAEIRKYNEILASQGIRGFIGAMVNGMEYLQTFGEDVVPYRRFPTLPAANFPNTEKLYNQLTKQNDELVVPSFEPVDTGMDVAKMPLMADKMASMPASKADLVGVGRSVSAGVAQPAVSKVARIYRVSRNSGAAEMDAAIRAIYLQVMDAAGEDLPVASDLEAKLRAGEISVREFVRQLASSDAYHERFVKPFPAAKAAEVLCRHLLGRTPATVEVNQSLQLMAEGGLPAAVAALVDGAEYTRYFGEDVVPYKRS